jgi:hypothetical protein
MSIILLTWIAALYNLNEDEDFLKEVSEMRVRVRVRVKNTQQVEQQQ